MGILDGIWLILLGVLAVPGLIIAKRPDARQLIDKIAPYQGWIGAISVLWGVFRLLHWFSLFPLLGGGIGPMLYFVVYTVYVFLLIVLGFMLGIGVLKTFIKDPNANAKMDQTLARLSPKQGVLGLVALANGAVLLIVGIIPGILL
jgi:heme O synthase-like polyprenyltransferase